jgi:hypothetical protein
VFFYHHLFYHYWYKYNSDVVDNFNLDYFDDDHIPLSGTIGSSPPPAERNPSFDPAVGFNDAFVAPSN